MITKQSKGKNIGKLPKAIGFSIAGSMAITIICAAIGTFLIDTEKIGEGSMGYLQAAILLLSSIVGAMLAVSIAKQKRLLIGLSSGAAYFASLIAITALFFKGQYSGVVETALTILAGVITVILFSTKSDKKVRKRAIR